MSEARVEIQVDEGIRRLMAGSRLDRLLLAVAEATLRREHRSGPDRVTLIITDDATLRELNREFMGYDEPTDVLSFNTAAAGSAGTDAPADGGALWPDASGEEANALGDIAISYERAVAQAEEAGHDLARELSVLTAHGVLHLLGYDHAEPGDQRVMFGKTDEILAEVSERCGSGSRG